MKLSLIVSVYDRPEWLRLCLQSLKLQTFTDFEIYVTDNSQREQTRAKNMAACSDGWDFSKYPSLYYLQTGRNGPLECYAAAEIAAKQARGEYLGFPSDDNWYAPDYCKKMIEAADANNWDLVYCDYLCAPRWQPVHCVVETAPVRGKIDKGGFFIRKKLFDEIGGFPGKVAGPSASDGLLCEAAAERGTHGRVPEVMWFYG